jgi:hypothetical protein
VEVAYFVRPILWLVIAKRRREKGVRILGLARISGGDGGESLSQKVVWSKNIASDLRQLSS